MFDVHNVIKAIPYIVMLVFLILFIYAFIPSNDLDIKCIIITLKTPERIHVVNELQSRLKKEDINTEIFEGVNGALLQCSPNSITYLKEIYNYDPSIRLNKQLMSKGEFGCALSHLNVYKKLVDSDKFSNFLILEDDVHLVGDLTCLDYLPSSFDIIHLGKSQFYPFELTEQVNEAFFKITKRYFNGAYAYIISKKCAKKLLTLTQNSCNLPADDLLSNNFVNGHIEVYVPFEPIFHHLENIPSVINHTNG